MKGFSGFVSFGTTPGLTFVLSRCLSHYENFSLRLLKGSLSLPPPSVFLFFHCSLLLCVHMESTWRSALSCSCKHLRSSLFTFSSKCIIHLLRVLSIYLTRLYHKTSVVSAVEDISMYTSYKFNGNRNKMRTLKKKGL